MASATLVLLRFGIPAAAAANETGAAAAGKAVYDRHCAACHGEKGDGNGPAAVWLYPKPRNFGLGLYKIQSTPAGSLPTDEDLLRSVTRGLGGSSMPSFDYLPEDQRRAVVDYVKHLTAYAGSDGRRINRFDEAKTSGTQAASIVVPPEPPLTFDSITRGKELYVKLQCLSCHGETGAGDGPSAPTLKDSLGLPIRPRDFSSGAFRGGPNGADLYTRVAVGLGGTPMVAFPDNVLNPADRWALVHFVQSLRQKDAEVNDILVPEDGLIPVLRSAGDLPADPADAAWERVDSVRVPLNPLWPEPRPIPAVGVRALHNGKELALMLQWRDETLEGAPIRVEDFQDAAALQFAMTGEFPFLGMGDAANPVNVWQWKAGWQQAVEGERPDLQTLHPAMHVDVYTEPQAEGLYRTAEAAGNLQAAQALKSPVEDANARGFGTLTSQPPAAQNVRGCGVWRDGSWSVVFLRQLSSPDADDVQLAPGRTVPIALAVWNGAQRDRNGRKAISNWFRLSLNP
jgi:mono/diheme cytochrome c family protein